MKPAAFEYHAPRSVDEALDLLAQYGDDGKVLAGGQSLVPLMNFRLARPAHLIDLNRVADLAYVRPYDGGLAVGAMTRQYVLEEDPQVAERNPLLPTIAQYIGHVQIRHRGTIGGSIAHADPVAELPLAATVLGAELVVRSKDGERVAKPEDFFLHYLMTTLEPTELLCEVRFPSLPKQAGWSVQEFARRHGDFAIVAAAAILEADADGKCTSARVAVAGGAPTPQLSGGAEAALVGQQLGAEAFEAAAAAAAAEADPEGDIHASADYRRKMVRVFVRRALEEAASRLGKES